METLGWYRYAGTTDSQGIGYDSSQLPSLAHLMITSFSFSREMERMAKRMGGSTKWPYNDRQVLQCRVEEGVPLEQLLGSVQ